MTVAITDANIFIDLSEMELLSLFFELPYSIHTTQEVLLECDDTLQEQLKAYLLQDRHTVHLLSDEQILEMKTLRFSKRLSSSDQSILYLAYKEMSLVLTGDQLIRKWCTGHRMEVHGILWVLEQFTSNDLLSRFEAIEKLRYLMTVNIWLPISACEAVIQVWEGVKAKQ